MALVKVGLTNGALDEQDADVLALAFSPEDLDRGKLKGSALRQVDRALGGVLQSAVQDAELDGKSGSDLSLHTHGKLPATHVVLLGVGAKTGLDPDTARVAASRAVKTAQRLKATSVALCFPFGDAPLWLQAAAEGAQLGAYRFDRYLSEKKTRPVEHLDLVLARPAGKADRQAVQLGLDVGEAVAFARDLVNEPASVMGPDALAQAARSLARDGNLQVQVLGEKEIEKLGMRLFLGVTRGSTRPPRLVHVAWEPGKTAKARPLALVGKAITFDSGGLSLKTAEGMSTMKSDMAGSAAVLGAMRVVAKLKPAFAVHAYLGACENMPSGSAQRPGDVVRGKNGKTVEVVNTDAEGRLVLADVLAWAAEKKPAALVDLATLTGAAVVALGPYTTAVYSTDEKLAAEVLDAAKTAGEDMWRLPLTESLKELNKSPVADLKNTGGRYGGSITAALFLREFVGDVPWAHLDIAGPAFLEKEHGTDPRGGTGAGVRTLVELVRRRMR